MTPTIRPVDLAAPGAVADRLAAVRQQMGGVPNIIATMARSPAALDAYLGFSGALGQGELAPALREQIALAVAGANGCDYCASAHTMLARKTGIDAGEAARNLRGEASATQAAAVLRFVREVIATRGNVAAGSVPALRAAGLSDAQVVEVVAHVALNTFTNFFNHVAGTEIDFPLVSTASARAA